MFCRKCKCCVSMWWSGFFALAAVAHTLRLVAQVQAQLGSWSVPMGFSAGVVIVAGLVAFIFCKKGCAACDCPERR